MPDDAPQEGAYASDAPLTSRENDRFNRWPFAKRVAGVLRDRKEASSLVVGLYGTWGEGKTTVLNFIEEALEDADGVVVVRFNPWRFGDEEALIGKFFVALASGIGASLKTKGDLAKKAFSALAGIATASASLALPGLTAAGKALDLDVDVSSLAGGGGPDLDTLRERLTDALREAGIRVVVRIDDIDRLDKDEVQAVFRLVKLSADFEHVAYVLALDPNVVAAALQERYGPGQPRAGYDFLEKVVTVPLNIPPARPQALYQIAVGAVNEALALSGAGVSDGGRRFAEAFQNGLLPALRTPRMAKRYGNAVRFALPVLAGEVNPTDQLLIEGMRVVYPDLYEHVRSNEAVYLRNTVRDDLARARPSDPFAQAGAELAQTIESLVPGSGAAAVHLVDQLFPAARSANRPDLAALRREKRAASEWYFDRYFSYAISDDSIADRDLAELVTLAESSDASAVADRLATLATPSRLRSLADALAFRASSITPEAAPSLAVALAQVSDRFATESSAMEWRPPQWQVLASVSLVIGRIPEGPERDAAAEAALAACPSAEAATTILRRLEPHEGTRDAVISVGVLDKVKAELAARVAEEARTLPPHLDADKSAVMRYRVWAEHRDRDEVADYLGRRLADSPEEVVALLRSQVPDVWAGGASESYPGDYDRGVYDTTRSYVNPEDIATALAVVYPADVLDAGWVEMDYVRMGLDGHEGVTEDEGIARQFMSVHQAALREEGTTQ